MPQQTINIKTKEQGTVNLTWRRESTNALYGF